LAETLRTTVISRVFALFEELVLGISTGRAEERRMVFLKRFLFPSV